MSKSENFSKTNQPEQRVDPMKGGLANKRKHLMTDALMVALNREAEGIVDDDGKPTRKLTQIAQRLVENAADGDMQAIKEVFDRTEGKAAQAIQLTGEDGGPVRTDNKWTVEFVNATPESK